VRKIPQIRGGDGEQRHGGVRSGWRPATAASWHARGVGAGRFGAREAAQDLVPSAHSPSDMAMAAAMAIAVAMMALR